MKKSYRYRRLRTYPKQKWAINAVQVGFNAPVVAAACFSVQSTSIVENPARNSVSGAAVSTASSILKCAHIKVKGVFNAGMIAGQSALLALMYCPEGINPNLASTSTDNIGSSIFFAHPEWVMSWTRMDYSDVAQKNEFSITSRLKRNLNPGDSVKLVVYNINTSNSGNASAVYLTATVSYCCRSN
jgi:hypothetical protein